MKKTFIRLLGPNGDYKGNGDMIKKQIHENFAKVCFNDPHCCPVGFLSHVLQGIHTVSQNLSS